MVNKKKHCNYQQSAKKGHDKSAEKPCGISDTTEKSSAKERNESLDKSKMTAGTALWERPKRSRTEDTEGVVVQSSGRISKRPKWDYDPYSPPKKSGTTRKTASKSSVSKAPVEPRKRGGREISIWTTHDKNNFFEGLKEHGRDWKALHVYLKKHNRGKSITEKTPEHIRQFYYRAWHKIAKYLKCPEGVDRQALEIFGLICYGEFRKRIGFYNMDPTMGKKLNEMVFKGVAFIRHRKPGTRSIKNYTIKTPRCTMLEKLNNLEGIKLHQRRPTAITLPREIVVELRPKSNDAWATVQAISQNPRIRTKADPEKRLSAFIDYMNKKWKSLRLKLKETMNEKEKPDREIKLHAPASYSLAPWDVTRLKPTKPNPNVQRRLGLETYMRILENMSSPTVPKSTRRISHKAQNNEHKESKLEPGDQLHIKSETSISKGSNDSIKNKDTFKCFRQRQNSKSTDSVDLKPVVLLTENPFSVLGTSNEVSTRGSSTNDSARTDPKSDFSSSPESRSKSLKREGLESSRSNPGLDKQSISVDDNENTEVNQEVLTKLDTVRGGMNRVAAETITVSDLYLMMAMPEKIVLEYEWVDIVTTPDYLGLGELASMLRRLVDVARTETELGKSKSMSQAVKQDDSCSVCTCGAYKLGTPPPAKRGSKRNTKPTTPKGSRKATNSRQPEDSSGSACLLNQRYSRGGVMSPPGVGFAAVQHNIQRSEAGQVPIQTPILQPSTSDGLFKVPVTVAPRPPNSSPITVNNIAQKLSPNALMEQITQANKHTDIFQPRPRQRRSRLRRPMIIQRILPRPMFSLQPSEFMRDRSYVPAHQPIKTTNGHVMKVMNPADVRSVTLKTVIGPQHHLSQMQVLESVPPLSSQPSVSQKLQAVKRKSRKSNVGHIPEAMHSGQVPVASLDSFLALNNYNSSCSSAPTCIPVSSRENIISQAALAHGIPLDLMPDSRDAFHANTDGALLHLKSDPTLSSSSPNMTIGGLLDLSLPALPEDSTDKLLDLSNSTFSVSGLLEGKGTGLTPHKDPGQEYNRLASPSQLSPSRLFKHLTAGSEESWLAGIDFNLSSFLVDSPAKKVSATNMSLQPSTVSTISTSHAHAAMSTSWVNESSRDSVIGKALDFSVVDGTLQSMMNENSLDYMSKFADIAREIDGTHSDEKQKHLTS